MQITEQIIERIARRTFNSMFAPALRQSNVVTGGAGSSVSWADNAGHANEADTATTADSASTAASANAAPWSGITSKPATATRWPAWSEVTDKPDTATRWPAWSEVTDKPDVAIQAAHNNLLASGNEFTFASSGFSGDIWLNYRTAGGLDGAITGYTLGDGAGHALGTITHSGNNPFIIRGELADAYINGTTYSTLDNGTYLHAYSGASETIIHFQRSDCSASGLDIRFKYSQDSSNPLQYRKCIDSNRFASTDWVTLIDSLNIGSQSVNYATSAGSATKATQDGDGNVISSTYLKLTGGTMKGAITCKANQYYGSGAYGIHMNNSDLIGCNSIRFGDNSDDYTEAIMFPNDALTSWDSFRATGGTFWWQYDNGNNLAKLNTNGFYLYSGLMRITNNSRTVDIGAQNSGAIHIYNDNSSPFFFNGDVSSNASKTYDLGSSTYPWGTLYAAGCNIYDTSPSVHVGTSSAARISLHWSSDSNRGLYDYSGYWVVATNGTNTFMMKGNVGIGTTSPSYKLHVSGQIYCTGGFTFLSDSRKKNIIDHDVQLSVDDIANAPLIHYTLKDDPEKRVRVGSIAQYWKRVLPESVNHAEDGTLSMNYDLQAHASVIVLARKVRELERIIYNLQSRIA